MDIIHGVALKVVVGPGQPRYRVRYGHCLPQCLRLYLCNDAYSEIGCHSRISPFPMRHSYLVIGGHTFRLKVEPSTISFLLLVVELSEGYCPNWRV